MREILIVLSVIALAYVTYRLLKGAHINAELGPLTPVTERGLRKYDHLPAHQAAAAAWIGDGINPRWHQARKYDLAARIPELAQAVQALVFDDRPVNRGRAVRAWLGIGKERGLYEHRANRIRVSRGLPLLARALDRMVAEHMRLGPALGPDYKRGFLDE